MARTNTVHVRKKQLHEAILEVVRCSSEIHCNNHGCEKCNSTTRKETKIRLVRTWSFDVGKVDLHLISVEVSKTLQRMNQQKVHAQPYGS